MRVLRRVLRWACVTAGLLALGTFTTFTISAALGAWLPHRNLWAVTEFADTPHRRFGSVDISRYGRSGMERRSWYPMIPGVHRLIRPLGWEWGMKPGSVTLERETRFDADASRQWGTLGEVARGEREFTAEATEDARGWPWLAFWCEIEKGQTRGVPCTVDGGIRLPAKTYTVGTVRCIPLRPIWRGLFLDSIIYAACWSLPVLVWPGLRSAHRHRRGRCPRCGYDLCHDHASGCPECGWGKAPKLSP